MAEKKESLSKFQAGVLEGMQGTTDVQIASDREALAASEIEIQIKKLENKITKQKTIVKKAEQYFKSVIYPSKNNFNEDLYCSDVITADEELTEAKETLKVYEEMKAFWNYEVINFTSLTWWENLWGQCKSIERIHTFHHTCHDIAWAQWLSCDNPYAKQDRSMMEAEGGNYFATIGLIYRKTDES
ncbi:MAG: hypothetical protein EOL97_12650 [Spirochaetia bacterium]|nr:hypothetical protein [Spirochaetia bacterium]